MLVSGPEGCTGYVTAAFQTCCKGAVFSNSSMSKGTEAGVVTADCVSIDCNQPNSAHCINIKKPSQRKLVCTVLAAGGCMAWVWINGWMDALVDLAVTNQHNQL